MRIAGVDAIAIDIPLTKNFGGSTYSVLKRSTVITRLRTAGRAGERDLQRRQPRGRPRDRAPDPRRARALDRGRGYLRHRAHLVEDVRAHIGKSRPQDAARSHRLHRLRRVGRDRQGDRAQRARAARRLHRQGADHLHRRLLHGGQDARRYRPRDGGLPAGRHGWLQIQGRGPDAAGRRATREGRARGRGPRLHARGRRQPRLDGA